MSHSFNHGHHLSTLSPQESRQKVGYSGQDLAGIIQTCSTCPSSPPGPIRLIKMCSSKGKSRISQTQVKNKSNPTSSKHLDIRCLLMWHWPSQFVYTNSPRDNGKLNDHGGRSVYKEEWVTGSALTSGALSFSCHDFQSHYQSPESRQCVLFPLKTKNK